MVQDELRFRDAGHAEELKAADLEILALQKEAPLSPRTTPFIPSVD